MIYDDDNSIYKRLTLTTYYPKYNFFKTLYYAFTDIKENQRKRMKHIKQKIGLEECKEEVTVVSTSQIKHPKEKQEMVEEDETTYLEEDSITYENTVATDIPENAVEVVPVSEVTHIITGRTPTEFKAKLKLDKTYPLVGDMQQIQEKESLLKLKESGKVSIKPSLIAMEPIFVTEVEAKSSVSEYDSPQSTIENKANKTIVVAESLVTSEIQSNISVSSLAHTQTQTESAKSTMFLKDAINVHEPIVSMQEEPLNDLPMKKANAAVEFSPLQGLSVLEVNDEIKEKNVDNTYPDKAAVSKLNFNLLESIQVGEVFVEDKSGKYYPELIVPTESAHKNILVSNQIITQEHNIQEREGMLSDFKLPPTQEADIDVTYRDSIVISVDELQEKEQDLPAKEKPLEAAVTEDLMLHNSLSNIVTTSQIKESSFLSEQFPSKKATIDINELQHKFNLETQIHDSETVLSDSKSLSAAKAEILMSTLDSNIIEEIQIHESEKEFITNDKRQTAVAELDVKAVEPILTSENVQMSSIDEMTKNEKMLVEMAKETFITSDAKIVTAPLVHDQGIITEFSSKNTETITQSLIPNIPIAISETETSESEKKLNIEKAPDTVTAHTNAAHHLKTPLSEEIYASDHVGFLNLQQAITEKAIEQRDLKKEITVLCSNVQEDVQKFDEIHTKTGKADTTYVGSESINITEIVSNDTEQNLQLQNVPSTVNANVDFTIDRKIAFVSEVTSKDSTSDYKTPTPNFEEVHITSTNLNCIQVLENKVLDSQSNFVTDVKPDFKQLMPEIISSLETVNVTEIVQHEKERNFDSQTLPNIITASTDVDGHPVATSSEVTVESNLGFTTDMKKEQTKKAHIENLAYRELVVSTTDYNEKEDIFKPINTNTVSASMHIDSQQAVVIQESSTETITAPLKDTDVLPWATAKESNLPLEALTQQEIVVHSSEKQLEQVMFNKENQIHPGLMIQPLKVPEYIEKLSIESEDSFSAPIEPDKQLANLVLPFQEGLQTTETLTQSEALDEVSNLKVQYKKIEPKSEHHIKKAVHIEETITNQSTKDFVREEPTLQNSNVLAVSTKALEQTEIVTAETESNFVEKPMPKSNISTDLTEILAVVTSCVETVDKEKDLDLKQSVLKQDASVGFVPLNSMIETEIVSITNVEKLQKEKPSYKANLLCDNEQKPLQRSEVLTGEKEGFLLDRVPESHSAKQNLIEMAAKEITEIQTSEKENVLKEMLEPTTSHAQPHIYEEQPITSMEVIATQDTQELILPQKTFTSALKTQGVQEAVGQSVPFIGEVEENLIQEVPIIKSGKKIVEEQRSVGVIEIISSESEKLLEKSAVLKTETLKPSLQSKDHVNVTEITLTEKEETLQLIKDFQDRHIEPTLNVQLNLGVKVDETVIGEGEEILTLKRDVKSETADISVQSTDYLNVSENIPAENETSFIEKKLPKEVTHDIILSTHKHLNIQVLQTSEQENIIDDFIKLNEESVDLTIEPFKSLTVSEVETEEKQEELISSQKTKEQKSSVGVELGDYITVTEIEFEEKEAPLESRPRDKAKKSEIVFEANIPVEVQETTPKEHENILPAFTTPQTLKPGISIESQQHVTISDTVVKESEKEIKHEPTPLTEIKLVDADSVTHITTDETIVIEDLKFIEEDTRKLENVQSKQIPLKEIINTQPQTIECLSSIPVQHEPDQTQANFDLELHKSVITLENEIHEPLNEIWTPNDKKTTADKQIVELKSLEQTEIVAAEVSELLKKTVTKFSDIAEATHIPLQEISQVNSEVLENIKELPKYQEPEINKASYEVEIHRSYEVTENRLHETSNDAFIIPNERSHVNKQVIEMKSIGQTEIVVDENVTKMTISSEEIKYATPSTIEHQPIVQRDIVANEKEIETVFDKLDQPGSATVILNTNEGISVQETMQEDTEGKLILDVTMPKSAQKSITPLTHLQCTENIAETKLDNLLTPEVHTETTTITPTSITPLIITDSTSFEHETELHTSKPKAQIVKENIAVAKEIEISTEFINEPLLPYSKKQPKFSTSTIKITDEAENRGIIITEQETELRGKSFIYKKILYK